MPENAEPSGAELFMMCVCGLILVLVGLYGVVMPKLALCFWSGGGVPPRPPTRDAAGTIF